MAAIKHLFGLGDDTLCGYKTTSRTTDIYAGMNTIGTCAFCVEMLESLIDDLKKHAAPRPHERLSARAKSILSGR